MASVPGRVGRPSTRMIIDMLLGALVMGTVGILIGLIMGGGASVIAGGMGVVLGTVVGISAGAGFWSVFWSVQCWAARLPGSWPARSG